MEKWIVWCWRDLGGLFKPVSVTRGDVQGVVPSSLLFSLTPSLMLHFQSIFRYALSPVSPAATGLQKMVFRNQLLISRLILGESFRICPDEKHVTLQGSVVKPHHMANGSSRCKWLRIWSRQRIARSVSYAAEASKDAKGCWVRDGMMHSTMIWDVRMLLSNQIYRGYATAEVVENYHTHRQ